MKANENQIKYLSDKGRTDEVKNLGLLNELIKGSNLESLQMQGLNSNSNTYNLGLQVEALVRSTLLKESNYVQQFNKDVDVIYKDKKYEIKSVVNSSSNAVSGNTPILAIVVRQKTQGAYLISSENIEKYNLIGKRLNVARVLQAGKKMPKFSKWLGFQA